MLSLITSVLASTAPAPVPESGSSIALFTCGVAAMGLVVRFLKSRNK